jgi:hypothetical protein
MRLIPLLVVLLRRPADSSLVDAIERQPRAVLALSPGRSHVPTTDPRDTLLPPTDEFLEPDKSAPVERRDSRCRELCAHDRS